MGANQILGRRAQVKPTPDYLAKSTTNELYPLSGTFFVRSELMGYLGMVCLFCEVFLGQTCCSELRRCDSELQGLYHLDTT